MQETVLELKNYSVSFDTPDGEVQAVRNVDLSVKKGEILCIVGESGCGKTVMCRSVMKLLPPNARVKNGEIRLCGENITDYKRKKMEKLCGSKVSMVFQDPMLTLNPTIPVGKQITEAIIKNQKVSRGDAEKKAIEMLKLVGISDEEQRYGLQPHFFSGGMRQRCVLAIALACNPQILFADEATTALDVTVEAKILDLLLEIREKTGVSIVFVSHDLGAVARIADRVAVMYAGKIVEIGTAEEVYYDPRHPYTWGLLSSLPFFTNEKGVLNPIPGMPPSLLNPPQGDAFAVRNSQALAIDYEKEPPMFKVSETHYAATWLLDERAPKVEKPSFLKKRQQEPCVYVQDNRAWEKATPDLKRKDYAQKEILIEAKNLKQYFRVRSDYTIRAVDDVSFGIREGEIMALVGETGCGKSTTARTLAGIYHPTGGELFYRGEKLSDKKSPFGLRQTGDNDIRKRMQGEIQMIFQDSGSSLNQKMKVRDIIEEPMRVQKIRPLRGSYEEEARFQMKYVGLDPEYLKKYPGELSGGQRQRVAFARALAPNPQVLLLDEPFAAIDAKVRTELRTWLKEMVTKLGITSIFVTHDQDEAVEVADEIIITNHGRIEQMGTPMEIYKAPDTPFVAQFIGRSSVVNEYDRLCGFDRIEGADRAVLRPEFVKLSRSEPERFISATEEGFVKDIVFRGNHLDIVVDIDGIEIVAERSLEKDPLEIGQKVYVLIYRLYIFDEHQTYLVENQEMQTDDVFYI